MSAILAAAASADDLRAAGLSVAVHNDYRLNGIAHRFWLFVGPDGMSYKGEGTSDAEALNQVRALVGLPLPACRERLVPTQPGWLEEEGVALLNRLKERLYGDCPLSVDQRRDLANTLDAIMHRAVSLG